MKALDLLPSFLRGILSVIALCVSVMWGAFMAVNTFFDSKVARAESRVMEVRRNDMEFIRSSNERTEREMAMVRSQINDIHRFLIRKNK